MSAPTQPASDAAKAVPPKRMRTSMRDIANTVESNKDDMTRMVPLGGTNFTAFFVSCNNKVNPKLPGKVNAHVVPLWNTESEDGMWTYKPMVADPSGAQNSKKTGPKYIPGTQTRKIGYNQILTLSIKQGTANDLKPMDIISVVGFSGRMVSSAQYDETVHFLDASALNFKGRCLLGQWRDYFSTIGILNTDFRGLTEEERARCDQVVEKMNSAPKTDAAQAAAATTADAAQPTTNGTSGAIVPTGGAVTNALPQAKAATGGAATEDKSKDKGKNVMVYHDGVSVFMTSWNDPALLNEEDPTRLFKTRDGSVTCDVICKWSEKASEYIVEDTDHMPKLAVLAPMIQGQVFSTETNEVLNVGNVNMTAYKSAFAGKLPFGQNTAMFPTICQRLLPHMDILYVSQLEIVKSFRSTPAEGFDSNTRHQAQIVETDIAEDLPRLGGWLVHPHVIMGTNPPAKLSGPLLLSDELQQSMLFKPEVYSIAKYTNAVTSQVEPILPKTPDASHADCVNLNDLDEAALFMVEKRVRKGEPCIMYAVPLGEMNPSAQEALAIRNLDATIGTMLLSERYFVAPPAKKGAKQASAKDWRSHQELIDLYDAVTAPAFEESVHAPAKLSDLPSPSGVKAVHFYLLFTEARKKTLAESRRVSDEYLNVKPYEAPAAPPTGDAATKAATATEPTPAASAPPPTQPEVEQENDAPPPQKKSKKSKAAVPPPPPPVEDNSLEVDEAMSDGSDGYLDKA